MNKVATTYTQAFKQKQYTKMARQVNKQTLKGYTAKTLASRNQAVFERMGATNIRVQG